MTLLVRNVDDDSDSESDSDDKCWLFLDIITSTTSAEYVKLIISCLDYSSEASFARLIFTTAITSASEVGRKWSTRFFGVLAQKNPSVFSKWGMDLLMGQLADPSAKVVRHALRLLTRWIPVYPECLPKLRKLRLEHFGDASVLLRTHLFGDESFVAENINDMKDAVELWKKEFNVKYVDIVEDDMKVELVNVKRSLDGNFARISNERSKKFGVFLPVHLYGQLALHETGREYLINCNEIDRLLLVLRNTPADMSFAETREVKASIFALANFVASSNIGLKNGIIAEIIIIMCRYAEACPVLSIRGTAFWGLNLIGSSKYGSKFLALLGWESSRYYKDFGDKERIGDWEIPSLNPSRLWISSLDVCTSDPHYIVKKDKDISQSTSLSRPSRSSTTTSGGSFKQLSEVIERKDTLRSLRALTNDSIEISGLSSTCTLEPDIASVLLNEFDFGIPNVPQRHIGDESVPDTLSTEETKGCKLHQSSILRAGLGLPSFEFGNVLAVEQFLSAPIWYPYMPRNELRSYRQFRELYPSTLEAPVDDVPLRFMEVEPPFITLPCTSVLTSKNIFAEEPYVSLVDENLREKLSSPEELKDALIERRKHRSDRCFYCSYFANVVSEGVTSISDVDTEERNNLLTLVEARFSKGSMQKANEKKILLKRDQALELFSSPCIYWDVFELLSDSGYKCETRRLIHSLFTDSLKAISSHYIKM
uniref:RICTOR_V domain-containing protein n=1 Tax=Syphacia muris TaxID=451379 RepID=A0A0N5AJA8_9BILA